jgi:hypothetical protein
LVKHFEGSLKVLLLQSDISLNQRSCELLVINLAVTVSVHMLHELFDLRTGHFKCADHFTESLFKLIHRDVAVLVQVKLQEKSFYFVYLSIGDQHGRNKADHRCLEQTLLDEHLKIVDDYALRIIRLAIRLRSGEKL